MSILSDKDIKRINKSTFVSDTDYALVDAAQVATCKEIGKWLDYNAWIEDEAHTVYRVPAILLESLKSGQLLDQEKGK